MIPPHERMDPSPGASSPQPMKFFLQYSASPVRQSCLCIPRSCFYRPDRRLLSLWCRRTKSRSSLKGNNDTLTFLMSRLDVTVIGILVDIAFLRQTQVETGIFPQAHDDARMRRLNEVRSALSYDGMS